MIDFLIGMGVLLIGAYFFKYSIQKQNPKNMPDELFPTERFTKKENVKSAKCPQCGKTATTYNQVKELFGLRRVGYTTDIQSWCRECRRNKEDNKLTNEDMTLFDE